MDDYWNVDGEKELSEAWTGFTRFILLNERPHDGFSWSGRRLTRKQTTSRPDNVWPDMWKHMSHAAKGKAKQKWAIEKPKLDNARKLRGIYFIDSEDEEFKLTMKNARRKLEIPIERTRARARVREGAREKEKEKEERKRKIREKKKGKEKRKEREQEREVCAKLHHTPHTRTTTHHHNTPHTPHTPHHTPDNRP